MPLIDISHLSKDELLLALANVGKSAGYFGGSPPPLPTEILDKKILEEYIDYYMGRVIKANLSGDTVDPWGYDRDNGQGAFQRVVNSLQGGSN